MMEYVGGISEFLKNASMNYCFWAIGVKIHFLYNKHGRVGRHMKVLGQINYILEGFFITDVLSLANLRITVLGLLG